MAILSVSNPVYGDAGNQTVLCQVALSNRSGTHPFLATASDRTLDPEGGAIYANALAGKYGAIGAYVAPTVSAESLRAYANQKMQALLYAPRDYTLSGALHAFSDATTATGMDLQALLAWGTTNPAETTNWVQNDGGVVTLTGAQCVGLAQAVIAYGQSVYAVLAQAMNGIANASITTTAQIDALAWPT